LIPVLHVFTIEGHTFTFYDVEIESENETTLVIRYKAKSDGRVKRGFFRAAALVGYSYATGGEGS
jgi:hypothetical protein